MFDCVFEVFESQTNADSERKEERKKGCETNREKVVKNTIPRTSDNAAEPWIVERIAKRQTHLGLNQRDARIQTNRHDFVNIVNAKTGFLDQ